MSFRRKCVKNEILKVSGQENNFYPPARRISSKKKVGKCQKYVNFSNLAGGVNLNQILFCLYFWISFKPNFVILYQPQSDFENLYPNFFFENSEI